MEYYAYTYKSDKAFVHRIFSCIITLDVQIKCTSNVHFQSSFRRDKTRPSSNSFLRFPPPPKKKKNLVLSPFDRTNPHHEFTARSPIAHDPTLRDKLDTSAPPFQHQKEDWVAGIAITSKYEGDIYGWLASARSFPVFSRNSRIHATPRGDTRIMARGPRHIDLSSLRNLHWRGGVQVKGSRAFFFSFLFFLSSFFPLQNTFRIAECRRVQGLRSKLIHRESRSIPSAEFHLGNLDSLH